MASKLPPKIKICEVQIIVMKVPLSSVSLELQERIKELISHRSEFTFNTGRYAVSIPAAMVGFSSLGETNAGKITAGLITAKVLGGVTLYNVNQHHAEFRKEYIRLLRALRLEARKNPALRELALEYPFLVVDRQGDLVGKKSNPLLMKWPIGRRRIISPLAELGKQSKWRASLPKNNADPLVWKRRILKRIKK